MPANRAFITIAILLILLPASGCEAWVSREAGLELPVGFSGQAVDIARSQGFDRESLMLRLDRLLSGSGGLYGVYVLETDTGEGFGINEDIRFEGASTIKVPILMLLYSEIETGRVSESEVMTFTWSDYEGGSGSIQESGPGSSWTIAELAAKMMKESDNVAKNMLLRRLGYSAVESYARNLGAEGYSIYYNRFTPREMAMLLFGLEGGRVAGEERTQEMLSLMTGTTDEDRLPRYLAQETRVAHKIGTRDGSVSDVGIVWGAGAPFIICVYSTGGDMEDAEDVIGRVAWLTAEHEAWRQGPDVSPADSTRRRP